MLRFVPLACLVFSSFLYADGPEDNRVEKVRPMPPPGIAIPEEARQELEKGLQELAAEISSLRKERSGQIVQYLPDVEILEKGVRIALEEDGFYDRREIDSAKKLLEEGKKRATELKGGGFPSWLMKSLADDHVTVRGFRSKLDGSVQPYGVIYRAPGETPKEVRGDVWCRGRAEKGLELQFIAQRLAGADPKPVRGVIMIHPFGRYCNANKLAGEVDTLEALEHALSEYPIDPKGVAIRGFSMGGAAVWHLAVHYPDKWFAATPGAGFSETPKFLNVFQNETLKPYDFEQTLWKLYDAPYWVNNLKNVPTIAYSGEIDKQKQAADVMAEASWNQPKEDRFELTHLIGPRTAHKIEPNSVKEIERRLANLYPRRIRTVPREVDFTTYTLKYNRCHWLTIDALEEHWSKARVQAAVYDNYQNKGVHVLVIAASKVEQLTIDLDANVLPPNISFLNVQIVNKLEGKEGKAASFLVRVSSDRSWRATLARAAEGEEEEWVLVSPLESRYPEPLMKKPGLQGPIDDAFMSSFIFVRPTGAGNHPAIDAWVTSEMDRAVREWHRQMRGDIRVVSAEDLKPTDIEENNLILWGDAKSNPAIADVLGKLPVKWSPEKVQVGEGEFDASNHVPVLIYPNPKNPGRYVVLNSSFTYREYDYLNNARQVPKLPDWAVIDTRTPPGPRWPGKIATAGFFDEKWGVK